MSLPYRKAKDQITMCRLVLLFKKHEDSLLVKFLMSIVHCITVGTYISKTIFFLFFVLGATYSMSPLDRKANVIK